MFIHKLIIEPLLCGVAVMFLNYGNFHDNRMEIDEALREVQNNIDISYELIQLKSKKITWNPNKEVISVTEIDKYLFSSNFTQPKMNIVPILRKSI
jgi:hypothetical protein